MLKDYTDLKKKYKIRNITKSKSKILNDGIQNNSDEDHYYQDEAK